MDFSGINDKGDFISLPMRTYSSGMAARLRFSIAAAKNHDVLMIDEALATGDRAFQKRSEARIRELRKEAGTVFLVSHNNKSIRDTCDRVLWLEKGDLLMDGPTEEVLEGVRGGTRRASDAWTALRSRPTGRPAAASYAADPAGSGKSVTDSSPRPDDPAGVARRCTVSSDHALRRTPSGGPT